MNNTTINDVLEHLDIVIEYLTYYDNCCSSLDIALELREDILENAYDDN